MDVDTTIFITLPKVSPLITGLTFNNEVLGESMKLKPAVDTKKEFEKIREEQKKRDEEIIVIPEYILKQIDEIPAPKAKICAWNGVIDCGADVEVDVIKSLIESGKKVRINFSEDPHNFDSISRDIIETLQNKVKKAGLVCRRYPALLQLVVFIAKITYVDVR